MKVRLGLFGLVVWLIGVLVMVFLILSELIVLGGVSYIVPRQTPIPDYYFALIIFGCIALFSGTLLILKKKKIEKSQQQRKLTPTTYQ